MVLGYLATVVASAVEGAIVVGGLSVLGAALAGIGVPKDSVLQDRDCSEGGQISGHRARLGCGTGARPGQFSLPRTPSSLAVHHGSTPALATLT